MMSFIFPIFQALLFSIFPTLLGRPLVQKWYKKDLSYPLISYFIVGGLTLYATILAGNYLVLPLLHISFSLLFDILLSLLAFFIVPLNLLSLPKDFKIKQYLAPIGVSAGLALFFYGLWQLNNPYPFNWDLLEHQTLVNNILSGKFSFITSHISDTFGFDGYSSLFHTLIAASQIVIPQSIFTYWHSASIIHFALAIFASYLVAYQLSENKIIGFLSALCTAALFDSSMSFTTLFLIPQTFTAVIFAFLLAQLIKEIKNGGVEFPMIIVGSLFLILSHYVIGSAAAAIYIFVYLYARYRTFIVEHTNRKLIIFGLLGLAVAAIAASMFVSFGFINHGEGADYTYTLIDKFNIMRQIFGFFLLIFLPLGIGVILKWKGELEMLVLVIAIAILSVILLQFPYVLKFYVLLRFFIDAFLAIGVYAVIRHIYSSFIRILAYMVLFITLTAISITNFYAWQSPLQYNFFFTNISPQEVTAAEFLKQKYGDSGTLLVSDPATQQILEPISDINTQGGSYMDSKTRIILDNISKTRDPDTIAKLLYQIQDTVNPGHGDRLFALSGRYFLWQGSKSTDKQKLSYNIWYPADLTLANRQTIYNLAADSAHFTLIYQNQTIVIFDVKQ